MPTLDEIFEQSKTKPSLDDIYKQSMNQAPADEQTSEEPSLIDKVKEYAPIFTTIPTFGNIALRRIKHLMSVPILWIPLQGKRLKLRSII